MSRSQARLRDSRPRCLEPQAPTTTRRRLTPLSRTPLTGRIGEALHLAAGRWPHQVIATDRPADIDPCGALSRTYAQWAHAVDEAAGWLHELGVRRWDRVAVLKSNHFDISVLACAAARLGAVPALLSGAYGLEIARPLLARLDRPFLVTDRAHVKNCGIDQDTVARLTERTVCVDGPQDRPDLVDLDDLRGAAAPAPAFRADDEAMIITHTSGTTGIPKLVVHTAESERSIALIESERWPVIGIRPSDVWAYAEPFWHERQTHNLLSLTAIGPRMLTISDPLAPQVRDLLVAHRPTLVEALPNIFLAWERMARDPARPFGRVREYINSFDAIHTRTIRTFLDASDRRMPIWLQAWSQSENGTLLMRPYVRWSVRRRGRRPAPTQLLGWPVPGLGRIRTVDPVTGEPTERGKPGLVQIAQPGRCLAYVGEPERHAAKRDGRWWHTGDFGVINRLGALRLVDREIDRLPDGSAIELEDVLLDRLVHTTEVIVLPLDGQRPVPVVSTADDVPLDLGEWRRATADLPALADPVQIRWEDFPRTGTWKIRRVELRERLIPGSKPHGRGSWT